MPYISRNNGDIDGLFRWPVLDLEGEPLPDQERLPEDHSDVVGFRVGRAKLGALAEVKSTAQAKVADLDSSVTKATAKAAVLPFKTQFQDATTQVDVDNVKSAAIAAIEAL